MSELQENDFHQAIENVWKHAKTELAFYVGAVSISLSMVIKYDGYGNARVWFVVTDTDGSTQTYEKHDAAATAYNMLRQKIG